MKYEVRRHGLKWRVINIDLDEEPSWELHHIAIDSDWEDQELANEHCRLLNNPDSEPKFHYNGVEYSRIEGFIEGRDYIKS